MLERLTLIRSICYNFYVRTYQDPHFQMRLLKVYACASCDENSIRQRLFSLQDGADYRIYLTDSK